MRSIPLTFWQGRDNPEELVLLQGSPAQPYDVTPLTRVVVGLDDDAVVLDSTNTPAAFQWPVDLTWRDPATGLDVAVKGLRLKLGLAGIASKTYGDARLTVYDAVNWPNGLMWTEALRIKVRA